MSAIEAVNEMKNNFIIEAKMGLVMGHLHLKSKLYITFFITIHPSRLMGVGVNTTKNLHIQDTPVMVLIYVASPTQL